MRGSKPRGAEIDLRLVHRILQLVVGDTERQIDKPLERDDPAEAIFELWRANKLKPPFDKLRSRLQLLHDVRTPSDLMDYVAGINDLSDDWTADTIERTLEQLKERKLIYEVALDRSRYNEPSKVLVLPLGLLVFPKITELLDKQSVSIEEFDLLIQESHPEHSLYALDAFSKRVSMSVQRSQNLSPFNISLAMFLLMYGATRRERALRIQVDPTNNIKNYPDIISGELTRIGQRILNRDPMSRGTLLDHIQESNKIKGVLDDSSLYIRHDTRSPDGGTQYSLYFDLGIEDITHAKTLARLDHILRAVIDNAKSRDINAPTEVVTLLHEHISGVNTNMKPVHTKTLFGAAPSIQYLMTLHERAEYLTGHAEEVEEQEDDDEDSQ